MQYLPLIIAFAMSAVLGPVFIPFLRKLKFGQNIREDGPVWHSKKSGTPTMGGLIFIIGTVIATFARGFDRTVAFILAFSLIFGLIGFIDDFIKVVLKRNLGLTARQKFLAQCAVAFAFVLFALNFGFIDTKVLIPFFKKSFDFGIWFMPLAVLFVVLTVNSVNLTDGLDGLATCISIVTAVFFILSAEALNFEGVSLIMSALVGSLLAFLIYNFYPAKVFMGDTGSLFLGGILSVASVMTGLELALIIAGGVFFFEALSVILQVACYKTTGKRIFKMSPVHHHFEMSGWHETKIVAAFTLASIILCVLAYFGGVV